MSEKPRERHRIMIDVPESTHRNLKVMTALKGMSVQQYIRGLIQSDMQCLQGITKLLASEDNTSK